jgi:hypothetical protein
MNQIPKPDIEDVGIVADLGVSQKGGKQTPWEFNLLRGD